MLGPGKSVAIDKLYIDGSYELPIYSIILIDFEPKIILLLGNCSAKSYCIPWNEEIPRPNRTAEALVPLQLWKKLLVFVMLRQRETRKKISIYLYFKQLIIIKNSTAVAHRPCTLQMIKGHSSVSCFYGIQSSDGLFKTRKQKTGFGFRATWSIYVYFISELQEQLY